MPTSSYPSPRRLAWGRFLDRLGQLGLPLGVGLFFGYWISDLGVPWTPTMLEILSLFAIACLLLVLAGQWLKGKVERQTEGVSRVRRRVVVLLGLAAIAAGVRLGVHYVDQPSPLTRLSHETLRQGLVLDTRQARELDAEMGRLVERLEASTLFGESPHPQPLSPGERGAGVSSREVEERRGLSGAEERLLRDAWRAFYANAFALDQIRIFYEDWYRFDPSRAERHFLVRSYLLTFVAELSLYEKSLHLSRLILSNPEAWKFLDAPHPGEGPGDSGLPEHTFSLFRQEFQGVRDQGRVLAGERYLRFLETTVGARELAEERGFAQLWQRAEDHLDAIRTAAGLPERAVHTLRADLQILRRTVRRTWFPAQQGVAEWMSTVKFRRPGQYLITPDQLTAAAEKLEPGDILLGRKNWYLTNVGLPGFWPHAMLYLGPADALETTFDTPEVRAQMERLTGEPLSLGEALASRFPEAWTRYRGELDGRPIEVLEALGEGVLLNSLVGTAGDYFAALRPRLTRASKARAIYTAFSHLEKPYDFDFDFATDHALVCTEVVWRSYRSGDTDDGLDLPLVEVAGRLTLPANEIARHYAELAEDPGRQLDFVLFLDARESDGIAIEADEAAFRGSWQRLKWDLAQR